MAIFDTICACITGAPPSAVAIVRLSGPESWAIAAKVFAPWHEPVQPKLAVYGRFVTGDDGLALPFAEGASFTGEFSVELSVHGSLAAIEGLLGACCSHGARRAKPGEFTERAFLNGRIDLVQAEAIRDAIEAVTAAQLRQASILREGRLSRELEEISESTLKLLALVEAQTDFSEELGPLDRTELLANLRNIASRLTNLLSTADAGRYLRSGIRIALAGGPNAGKSSLLNWLVGHDRSIVTEIPGTTRDYIEEQVEIGANLVILTDTAGLRECDETIEREGIRRSRSILEKADWVWYLYDAARGWSPEDELEFAAIHRPKLKIATKSDLNAEVGQVCALKGTGFEFLERITSEFTQSGRYQTEALIRTRHELPLRTALTGIGSAMDAIAYELPLDLAAVGLQTVLSSISEVLGRGSDPEVLDRLFREFCLGK